MDANIPSPDFSNGNSDFLQFNSTPVDGGRNFKPKWGKRNRQDNWNRFGDHLGQQSPSDSPVNHQAGGGWREGGYRGGHGRGRGGGWRGGGRGWRGAFNSSWHAGNPSHHQYPRARGGGNNSFHNQGQNRHNRNTEDYCGGYFHPAMLEDPWAHLNQNNREDYEYSHSEDYQEDGKDNSISESMIAQVGDTIHERVEKICDDSQVVQQDNAEEEKEHHEVSE